MADKRSDIVKANLNKEGDTLVRLIIENKYSDEDYFWQLLTLLGENVNIENSKNNPVFLEASQNCMVYIVDNGKPEELVLALLEQADSFDDVVRFKTFLKLIQQALLKLTSKQQFSLELAIETLNDTISDLDLPNDNDLEDCDKADPDLDLEIKNISNIVSAYLDFLTPFVEQVSTENSSKFSGENKDKQIQCLVKCLLKILNFPLVMLDLTFDKEKENETKSNIITCVKKLMSMLVNMRPNLHELLEESLNFNERLLRKKRMKRNVEETEQSYEDQEPIPMLCLSCLAYLTQCEPQWTPKYPCLVPRQAIFEFNLRFVRELMNHGAIAVRSKGVALFQTMLDNLDETVSLTYEDLDRSEYFQILGSMFDIMIHCAVKWLRQKCVQMVPEFIQMFNYEARYQIFVKLFGTIKHSGALGFCVTLLKNQMGEVFGIAETGSPSNDFFCGLKLKKLVLLITILENGPATDLVENSDRLIAVLNFIRFITLRDPPATNQTGFWDIYPQLEKEFLNPLQTGLDMAKGHYRLELTGLDDVKKTKSSLEEEVEMSVSVAGFSLPKMPRGQKIEILNQALNTLDLITSLVARVNELIDQQKKAGQK